MPEPFNNAVLSAEQSRFWRQEYPGLEQDEFIELACNTMLPLPVNKLAPSMHLPACWLGARPPDGLLPEDRAEQQREYQGWRPIKYMLILPAPNEVDVIEGTALNPSTPVGSLMRRELVAAGIRPTECVATHVCRFTLPPTLNKYSQRHKKDGAVLVHADVAECKPDVIIALGADALKCLYGKSAKLDTYQGNTLTYTAANGHTAKVVPTYSPLAFLGGYAEKKVFQQELRRAMEIGRNFYPKVAEDKTDYRVCKTAGEVEALCNEIQMCSPPWVSFDTEFGNDCAREEHTRTISIQLGWGPGKAAFIPLVEHYEVTKPPPDIAEYEPPELPTFEEYCEKKYKHPWNWFEKHPEAREKTHEEWSAKNAGILSRAAKSYRVAYDKAVKAVPWNRGHEYHYEYEGKFYKADRPIHGPEDWHRVWYSVQQLLLNPKWRICAHHLRTDCEQFERNGYPITERIEDGIDTMLIHHLLYGDESQGLDLLVRKYLPHIGAFWMELEEYLDGTGARNRHLDFGYRDIPLSILVPYALRDADVTWQCAEKLLVELSRQPRLKQLYFKHVSPTSWHLYQVERQGILVDDDRRAELHDAYEPIYLDMLETLREEIGWPGFNPNSDQQMQTLLFYGATYRGSKPPPTFADGPPRLLRLLPAFNTDKYPIEWEDIMSRGEEEYHGPSVKAAALDLLHSRYSHPDKDDDRDYSFELVILKKLKHISVIGKMLSTYLAPQVLNEFGVIAGGNGLHNNIYRDGRVRTHLSQLTATGRYTSSRANLQTKPKKQEAAALEAVIDYYFGCSVSEYKKRCSPEYEGEDKIPLSDQINIRKFATCFIAKPGYCLIEADFATAEVYIWAYASGDKALIELVDAGRDMHSENTAKSFDLPERSSLPDVLAALESGDPEPYETWCDNIKSKYGALRVAAKSVVFG